MSVAIAVGVAPRARANFSAPSRLVALDGLRGVAALMVFVHHAALPGLGKQLVGMDAGVLVFFALSGYLLYAPFVAGPVDLRAYAIRRLLRIVPAYLVAAVGIGLLFYPETLGDPIGILTMSHTSVIVAWTLQLEVVFYAVVPLAAWFLSRRAKPARFLVWAGVASLVATLAVMVVRVSTAGVVTTAEVGTFVSFAWAFVPGMLVAQLRPTRVPAWVATAGVALIGLSVVIDPPPYLDLFAGMGAGLVIAYLVSRRTFPGGLAPVAELLGALSYSFYLWHEAIVSAVDRPSSTWSGVVVALALTTVIAAVVYAVVERPAIGLGRRLSARTW